MKWVVQEIEFLGHTSRRQVFSARQPFHVIADCLSITREHSRFLTEVGMDVTFLLDHIFHADIITAIQRHATAVTGDMEAGLRADGFGVVGRGDRAFLESRPAYSQIPRIVSKSVYQFYACLADFGDEMGLIMSIKVRVRVRCVCRVGGRGLFHATPPGIAHARILPCHATSHPPNTPSCTARL
jgi:hypothetical protein